MSISQRALILIRLDARRHEAPVTVADLAAHMNLPADVVRVRIQELAQEGYVEPVLNTAGPDPLGLIVAVHLVEGLRLCD